MTTLDDFAEAKQSDECACKPGDDLGCFACFEVDND